MRRVNPPAIAFILLAALVLRLAYSLSQSARLEDINQGGDSRIYLEIGYNLVTGYDYSRISIPVAPLYPVFAGLWQALLPPEAAVIVIRVIQAVMGTATCYFAYRLAWAISGGKRAGLIAAGALSLSPAFIIESGAILTETLYIFLVTAALWVYLRLFTFESAGARGTVAAHVLAAGGLLGLAALTRAVLLLFPVGLAVHLLLALGWKRGLRAAALLLVAYALVVSTWTIYNGVRWGRWVIAAPGFSSFVYLGAAGWDDPDQVDRNLAEQAGVPGALPTEPEDQQKLYSDAAANIITGDFGGYLRRRIGDLANAYLQPHGTIYFGGESLKDLTANWLRDDRTPGGLLRLAQGDAFWPKLAIYAFHYAGLLFGLAGMWLARRRWRLALPLVGFIAYTTLVHFVLDALPRYIFPTTVCWWVFAGVFLGSFVLARNRRPETDSPYSAA